MSYPHWSDTPPLPGECAEPSDEERAAWRMIGEPETVDDLPWDDDDEWLDEDDDDDILNEAEYPVKSESSEADEPPGGYRCVVCRRNWVDAGNGFDTCAACLRAA